MLRRVQNDETRVWRDFEERQSFLQQIGYLDDDLSFLAGAKILQHVQIEEIFTTELILSGILEDLDNETLFGILCGMTNRLPRTLKTTRRPTRALKRVIHQINQIRSSPEVTGAERITGYEFTWDPDVIVFGILWAQGRSLAELSLMYIHNTDFSGSLVSGFRRARELLNQISQVYKPDPETFERLKALSQSVARDEVSVIG